MTSIQVLYDQESHRKTSISKVVRIHLHYIVVMENNIHCSGTVLLYTCVVQKKNLPVSSGAIIC